MSILILIFVVIIYLYYTRQYKMYVQYTEKSQQKEIEYPHVDDPFYKDGHK